MTEQRTIVFFPEGAPGPTEACAAIGDVLLRRGHRVVFIVDEPDAGTLEARGFEERLVRLAPEADREPTPETFWSDFLRDASPAFRRSTLEQLSIFVAPTWQALVDGARNADERLDGVLGELAPDVVVEDNVVSFPALGASGRPWVRLVSSSPTEIKDPLVPPFASGYPAGDRTHWGTFIAEVERTHRPMWAEFNEWVQSRGGQGLTWHETGPDFIAESPWLNLLLYPEEADYRRSRPLGATWHRIPSLAREATGGGWRLPDRVGAGSGALILLALGSLGAADTALMQRLIDILARTRHRVVVETGPLGDRLRLPDGMTGEAFLPHETVLARADLVITSGANHAVTAALGYGKPLVVLPLFWDQHDNAQRIDEVGLGVRLAPYGFRDAELTRAIERLLGDHRLHERLASIAGRSREVDGTTRAADLIERVAVTGDPVAR